MPLSQVHGPEYDDYEDYKYGVDDVYGKGQLSENSGPSNYYGDGSGYDHSDKFNPDYGRGDGLEASDYGQRLSYGNGDRQPAGQMKKPPTPYEQRSTAGYRGGQDTAVPKSPFTANRESSAYSSVSK